MKTIPGIRLDGGTTIPQLGLGVFKMDRVSAQASVEQALAIGYRHIDTAATYYNEREVGKAIAASGVPREALFVTTKLPNDAHKAGDVDGAFGRSLEALGLNYVDLYLIHWPMPGVDKYVATWRRLESFLADGRAAAIGVSNFLVPHLERLFAETDVRPVVDQIECHPLFQQRELRAYLGRHGIVAEAWGPLGQGKYDLAGHPAIAQAAGVHGVSPAQVVLRWHVQQGRVAIPKAASAAHQRENLDVWNFKLTDAELAAIDRLDSGSRLGGDPNLVNDVIIHPGVGP